MLQVPELRREVQTTAFEGICARSHSRVSALANASVLALSLPNSKSWQRSHNALFYPAFFLSARNSEVASKFGLENAGFLLSERYADRKRERRISAV